jgi:hypothetical protein
MSFESFLYENNFVVDYGKCSGEGYGIPYWASIENLMVKVPDGYSLSLAGYGKTKEEALLHLKEKMSGKLLEFNMVKEIQCPIF